LQYNAVLLMCNEIGIYGDNYVAVVEFRPILSATKYSPVVFGAV